MGFWRTRDELGGPVGVSRDGNLVFPGQAVFWEGAGLGLRAALHGLAVFSKDSLIPVWNSGWAEAGRERVPKEPAFARESWIAQPQQGIPEGNRIFGIQGGICMNWNSEKSYKIPGNPRQALALSRGVAPICRGADGILLPTPGILGIHVNPIQSLPCGILQPSGCWVSKKLGCVPWPFSRRISPCPGIFGILFPVHSRPGDGRG